MPKPHNFLTCLRINSSPTTQAIGDMPWLFSNPINDSTIELLAVQLKAGQLHIGYTHLEIAPVETHVEKTNG